MDLAIWIFLKTCKCILEDKNAKSSRFSYKIIKIKRSQNDSISKYYMSPLGKTWTTVSIIQPAQMKWIVSIYLCLNSYFHIQFIANTKVKFSNQATLKEIQATL